MPILPYGWHIYKLCKDDTMDIHFYGWHIYKLCKKETLEVHFTLWVKEIWLMNKWKKKLALYILLTKKELVQ